MLFIAGIFAVIIAGLPRAHPVVPAGGSVRSATATVGLLLLLRAFASGCSALTGVEAIANAVPSFRKPRVRRAQHTEVGLGVILGLMLHRHRGAGGQVPHAPVGQGDDAGPAHEASLGHNFLFYAIQLITTVLLALAANTSFGGLPVLASLLATDNFLPHLFFLRAARQVHRYGVIVLALFAGLLLLVSKGDTQALVPLFAIGVFVGFTLSQTGMVRHWRENRSDGWRTRAVINGVGAVFTLAALAIELVSKFTEGAWLIVIIVPAFVLLFSRIHTLYQRIGTALALGERPPHPERRNSLVVVPVGGMSRLTAAAISTALSLGDEVIAVTVSYAEPEDTERDAHFREQWEEWHPDVPLLSLRSVHRSLGPPVVEFLRELERAATYDQLVVLIPEIQATRPWHRILQNQRGFVLEQAIQRGTSDVVICRLRYRLATVASGELPGGKPGRPDPAGTRRSESAAELAPARPAAGRVAGDGDPELAGQRHRLGRAGRVQPRGRRPDDRTAQCRPRAPAARAGRLLHAVADLAAGELAEDGDAAARPGRERGCGGGLSRPGRSGAGLPRGGRAGLHRRLPACRPRCRPAPRSGRPGSPARPARRSAR